jgi:predicted RNase H-like nuclease (RuvC/YqgF family)
MPVRESQLSKTNEDVRNLTRVLEALTARVAELETQLAHTQRELRDLAARAR